MKVKKGMTLYRVNDYFNAFDVGVVRTPRILCVTTAGSYKCEEKLVPEWWGKSKRKAIKKRIVFIQNRIKEVKLTGNKEVSKYDLSMRWRFSA